MGWFTGSVLYSLIWWVTLFAVLPLGVRSNGTPDAQSGWRGVPIRPRLGRKLVQTTLFAAVLWAICAIVIEGPWFSFRSGWLALPPPSEDAAQSLGR